jgi:uncharacterized protein
MTSLLLFSALALGVEPSSEVVEHKTGTGTLYGTFDMPVGNGPWPVIFIHPGSGPTDRDGNSGFKKNDSLKLLGAALRDAGFACLRIDKRGVAASAKAVAKEEDLRLTTYSDDVTAWVKHLRTDKRFTKVGFVGHSEGSLIGSLAGEAKFDAFVSLCGPGRKLAGVLREQLTRNVSKEVAERAEPILLELEAGRTLKDTPKDMAALFRPSVQPYLISMLKVDPAAELAKLTCPVLVVSGTTDIQATEDDAKALIAAKTSFKSVRIENMNHVLKEVKSTVLLDQQSSYSDPKQKLHPQLSDELVRFFRTAFAGK